jgi:hypothetical protein
MQLKLRNDEETEELLMYADYLGQRDGTGNTDIRKLKKEIRNASTAKIDVIEAIDANATQNIKKNIEMDGRITSRIKGANS